MNRQYQGPEFPILNNRQPPSQHQHPHPQHYHHQRQQQQQQQPQPQMRRGLPINNQKHPVNQQQYSNQLPQVSEDRLIHLIRTILREETTNHY